MSQTVLFKIVSLCFLLVLSGFFSGSETSLFSLGRIERYRIRREDEPLPLRLIHDLLRRPRRLLISLLIGSQCVNIMIAALAASLTVDAVSSLTADAVSSLTADAVSSLTADAVSSGLPPQPGSLLFWKTLAATAFVFPLLLLMGEIIPKTLALRYPQGVARFAAIPLYLFSRLVAPFRYLLWHLSNGIVRLFLGSSPSSTPPITEREFRTLVDQSKEGGALWASEHRFIHNIFDFGETRVSELMTPRTDMVCLQTGQSFQDVMAAIEEHHFSRIPVYEKDKDDIVGILYSKDLLNEARQPDGDQAWSLRSVLRTPYFIPGPKKANDLFREFRANRIHMAICVDEYGGVAGLVTMEDLLEDLFGEILDEYDPEEPRVRQLDDHTLIIPARMPIEDFNRRLDAGLPEDEYDTMGGMVFDLFGKLPTPGTKVSYMHYTFTVEKMMGTRIVELRVQREPGEDEDEPLPAPALDSLEDGDG